VGTGSRVEWADRPGGALLRAAVRAAGAAALVLASLSTLAPSAQAAGSRSYAPAPASAALGPHWQLAVTTPASPVDGQAPLPFKDIYGAGPAATAFADLAAVSCANVFFCAAVGQYQDAAGATSGLLDVLWDGRWRAYAAPEPELDPAGGGPGIPGFPETEYSGLDAVSCPAVGTCIAVGSYRDSQTEGWGLIETFSDGTWHPLAAPEPATNPAGEPPGREDQTYTGLYSISCTSGTSCVAVGMYSDVLNFRYGLIDTLSGGKWTALAAPEPPLDGLGAGRGTDDNAEQAAELAAVTCLSPSYCVAVGRYQDAKGVSWALADEFTGRGWAPEAPAEPDAAQTVTKSPVAVTSSGYGFLSSVSCAAPGQCAAVGAFAKPSQQRYGLLDYLSDRKWSAVSAPEPLRDASGAGAGSVASGPDATLSAVACSSVESCVSVGNYMDSDDRPTGLVDVLAGGSWEALDIPEPGVDSLGGVPGSDVTGEAGASLTSASCQERGICVGAGTYNDSIGNSVGLIDQYSSGSWRAVAAPAPNGPFQLGITDREAVTVTGVACSPDGTCALVGTYEDGQGDTFGLIDRFRY